jgi:transcriptional regulator with XRE-family HTH domain
MTKYTHLHEKIRWTRKSLGLKQREFIARVSEELGRTEDPLSQGLVSQWESGRTTPKPEQIVAIAKCTPAPWWTALWFMHDTLPADRGVDYNPDGSFVVEPVFGEEELEGLEQHWRERQEAAPDPKLLEWEKDSKKILDLREFMARQEGMQDGMRYIAATKNQKNSNHQDGSGVSVQATGMAATAAVGNVTVVVDGKAADKDPAEQSTARPKVSISVEDVVAFPKPRLVGGGPAQAAQKEGSAASHRARMARYEQFDKAVEYFLGTLCHTDSINFGFSKTITSGPIRVRPFFYFQGVSVIKFMLDPETPMLTIPPKIRDALGQLLLIDRIQNRSAKKMILISTYESKVELEPLIERYEHHVNSSKLLGVHVAFTSGPEQSAGEIARLLESYDSDAN